MRGTAVPCSAILVVLLSALLLAQGTRSESVGTPQPPQTDTPAVAAGPPSPPGPDSNPRLDTIVIDPGHGGDDPGARGAEGVLEKALTLAVARRVKAAVERTLNLRVVLTREDDRGLGPDERAAIANNAKADLFLSLHVNASPAPGSAGAEVYHLRAGRSPGNARRGANGESLVLPVAGEAPRTVNLLRWDTAQARHADTSLALGVVLAEQLGMHVPMSPDPLRDLPLRVLTGVDMPAAVVEMAYLTNPEQALAVQSDEYQAGVTQAIVDAVALFRSYIDQQEPQ